MRSKRAEHSSPGGVTLQESRWENHLPQRAGHVSFDAVQGRIGFPGCKHTLPAYVDFLIYQHPQVLLFRAVHSLPSLCLCLKLPWPWCSTLQPTLLNFMRFIGPPLSLVKVPLNGMDMGTLAPVLGQVMIIGEVESHTLFFLLYFSLLFLISFL